MRNADPVAHRKPRGYQHQPRNQKEGAGARHAVERQKQARKHQRRTHVFLHEKEDQRERYAGEYRQGVFQRRDIEGAKHCGQRRARFHGMPQHVPSRRKVSRQEEYQQDADDLHGLKAEEVDLCVARARARPQNYEQHR